MKLAFGAGVAIALGFQLVAAATPHASDHFTCSLAHTAPGAARFEPPPDVHLVDRVGASTARVQRPRFLCAPTDKNGEDATAPSHPDHLEDYAIKPAPRIGPV